MTLSPADYRTWRTEAAGRDGAYAAGWQAGHEHAGRRRLVAVAVVAGAVVLAGRLRLHPVVVLALAVAVVAVLWPVLLLVLAVELTVRHHRRRPSWPETAAYALSWLVGIGLGLLALGGSGPALVGLLALVGGWTAGPRALAWWRSHGRGPGPTGGGARYDWPPPEPPFTDADRTLGAGDPDRPGAQPYRVTFTSKARHIETRRYCDGHLGHVDTITGEAAPDPFEGL